MPDRVFSQEREYTIPGKRRRWVFRLSIVRFDPKEGEEIFLSYSGGVKEAPDFQHGPGIVRDGQGSPWMRRYDNPWEIVVDTVEQRVGTWLIDDSCRSGVLKLVHDRMDEARHESNEDRLRSWEQHLEVSNYIPDHTGQFEKNYSDYEIIGKQGCGDLTMNSWNVAFLRSRHTADEPKLIYLRDEPLETRIYSCLIKWKQREPRLQIADVRLQPYRTDEYMVMLGGEPIADKIEFAIYGKPVVRNGHVLDLRETVHQYADVRHLFLLPNLNPPGRRPQFLFGRYQQDSIYFGEAQLLNDRNLRRAALSGPVEIDRLYEGMGISVDALREALNELRYREVLSREARLLRKGEWRLVYENDRFVDIFLKRSQYGCGMIGLDKGGRLLGLVSNARAWDQVGTTIEQDAKLLQEHGTENALIFDEGADAFQTVRFAPGDALVDTVPRFSTRFQMRAVFFFARKRQE